MIFEGLSLKEINKCFLESESPTLKKINNICKKTILTITLILVRFVGVKIHQYTSFNGTSSKIFMIVTLMNVKPEPRN